MEQFYKISEVAKIMYMDEETIFTLIKSGKLRAYKLSNYYQYLRIKESDFDDFINPIKRFSMYVSKIYGFNIENTYIDNAKEYTPKEVANMLCVDYSFIYRLIRQGKLKTCLTPHMDIYLDLSFMKSFRNSKIISEENLQEYLTNSIFNYKETIENHTKTGKWKETKEERIDRYKREQTIYKMKYNNGS